MILIPGEVMCVIQEIGLSVKRSASLPNAPGRTCMTFQFKDVSQAMWNELVHRSRLEADSMVWSYPQHKGGLVVVDVLLFNVQG